MTEFPRKVTLAFAVIFGGILVSILHADSAYECSSNVYGVMEDCYDDMYMDVAHSQSYREGELFEDENGNIYRYMNGEWCYASEYSDAGMEAGKQEGGMEAEQPLEEVGDIDIEDFDLKSIFDGNLKDFDSIQATGSDWQVLSLPQCVFIALRDNEGIETAYLSRESQKRSILDTENAFVPTGSVNMAFAVRRTHGRDILHTTEYSLPAPSLNLSQRLLTGGSVSFAWSNNYSFGKTSGVPGFAQASSSLSLSLSQPLLRGGGFDIGRLPLTRAYLAEESNILSLRSTVISTITSVVKSYRSYVQAIQQFDIDKRAVERAQDQYEKDIVLVEAGIKPENDLLNSGRNVASREFTFEDRVDALAEQRIALLRLMNLDTDLDIAPMEIEPFDITEDDLPTVSEALDIAFLNNPSYLQQLIALRQAELAYMEAQNNTLWDLGLTGSIRSNPGSVNSVGRANELAWDFRDRVLEAGLTLTIPVNDTARESQLIGSRISLRSSRISLRQTERNLRQQIKNLLRGIKQDITQLKFARLETSLAKRQLAAKKIQLEAGETTSFEYSETQGFLITAETREISTFLGLLDKLTDLDALLGTTLISWNISLREPTSKLPNLENTFFKQAEDSTERNRNGN